MLSSNVFSFLSRFFRKPGSNLINICFPPQKNQLEKTKTKKNNSFFLRGKFLSDFKLAANITARDWRKTIPLYPMGGQGRETAGHAQHSASHTTVHRRMPA
jgi:hypothetical protein